MVANENTNVRTAGGCRRGSYLRLTGLHLGLLINFNESLLKHGIVRIVNNFNE